MRVRIYVEGEADRRGLKALLAPLVPESVGVDVLQLRSKERLIHEVGRLCELTLKEGKADHVFAIADLHPSRAGETVETLKRRLRDQVPVDCRTRFHPHVAKWELEAWLLANPDGLKARLRLKAGKLPSCLRGDPEELDDENPPSRRLDEAFRKSLRRHYEKVMDGDALFGQLGERIARSEGVSSVGCLQAFLDDLLRTTRNPP